jgi:ATP-dependent DNA helicase RecG
MSREELLRAPVRWPRPSRLQDPLEQPAKKLAAGLRALALHTVGDLLEHLPSDSREARTVGALRAGDQATVEVQVRSIGARAVRRRGMRPLVEATVFDDTGTMRATFFNQPWLVERYPPGTRLVLHGKLDERGHRGFRVSHHAEGAASGSSDPADPGRVEPRRGDPSGGAGSGGSDGSAMRSPDRGEAVDAVAHYPAAEGVTST